MQKEQVKSIKGKANQFLKEGNKIDVDNNIKSC